MSNAFLEKILATAKSKSEAIKNKAKTLKPTEGSNRYVILPGWRKGEEDVFFHDYGQHFVKNAEGKLEAIYMCMDKTHAESCPVCQAISQASASVTDDSQIELLKDASTDKSQSFLLNVIALDSEDKESPQILEVRKTVFNQILELMVDWGAAMFDPNEPIVIKVNREGKGLNTKYTVAPTMTKHPLKPAVFEKLNDLDDYTRKESDDQARRTISAVQNIVGILPPTTAKSAPVREVSAVETARLGDVPTTSVAEAEIDDDLNDLLDELDETA
jgi:hypothetical protein